MSFRIARTALHDFVEEQIAFIEATPVPADVRGLAPTTEMPDDLLEGVWLGAGLATQVGLAILEAPERWVEAAQRSYGNPAVVGE
jgi:hypothetical protein